MRPAVLDAQVRSLFFQATRIEPDPAFLEKLSGPLDPVTWEAAAQISRRVSLEPLFHRFAARQAPAGALSAATRSDLEAHSRLHAFRWAEIREAVDEALEALAVKGIKPVLLKGISLVG